MRRLWGNEYIECYCGRKFRTWTGLLHCIRHAHVLPKGKAKP